MRVALLHRRDAHASLDRHYYVVPHFVIYYLLSLHPASAHGEPLLCHALNQLLNRPINVRPRLRNIAVEVFPLELTPHRKIIPSCSTFGSIGASR